jgi:Domain of Unknown Function (DUF1080)
MTIRPFALVITCALLTPMTAAQSPSSAVPSDGGCARVIALTPEERATGWQLLFDGKSKNGWHGYNGRDVAAWTIEECALKTTGTQTNYGSDLRPDLVTDAQYTNFELSLDWKGSKAGNSGIMYGVIEDPKYQAAWMTGPEYQLIDDVGFPQKLELNRQAGADYSMHAPDAAQKTLKPIGEWNTTRLVVNGAHVEHWLNGKKIVEFERWTPEWNALRDAGKWKDAPDYGKAKTGHIALQDHGSIFWFRNVKLRVIP